MKRLARTCNNPRLKEIHLHTFRYCKGLREYHKTKDALQVMDILKHKKLDTTYYYIRIYKQIYKPEQHFLYVTKIGSTKEERIDFINDSWELVKKDGDDWYFRKPKLDWKRGRNREKR